MKQTTTILAVLVSFTMSAQLAPVTENGKTGQRLTVSNAANHGNIGLKAVDLGYSSSTSTTRGATGNYSTVMGFNPTASGVGSCAMGFNTRASGIGSYSTGNASQALGNYSFALGVSTTALGTASAAMGLGTRASDYNSFAIGQYNSALSTITTNGSSTSFNTNNTAFVIGNGISGAKSDAFKVMFNGDATLSGDLTINSDERLKENIQPLGSTLDKLHQIEGKTYSLKKDEKHTPKIGVLAQEVQAVFPELVTEGGDGILSVNYQGLVPVLINAINEQEVKIAALEAQNEQLSIASKKIAALEAQNAEIKELKEMVRLLALKQSKTSSTAAAN